MDDARLDSKTDNYGLQTDIYGIIIVEKGGGRDEY